MNTMMLALLQGRLWDAATRLQHQLQVLEASDDALADELTQVFAALDALQHGRYGQCGVCDRALELDQLLRKPHQLRCVACGTASWLPPQARGAQAQPAA